MLRSFGLVNLRLPAKLQRLLNAAARLLSGTKKFDRGLSQLMHVDLHWLDVPERVKYKLVTMVHITVSAVMLLRT